ncbi:serine hydrolase [Desulfosporosinus sp. OT]|uniref:D-alanyl-D-alanine carboxypeptidase family protein n=1 Tax=Desulfosporosinus sp. OT TaxID=913865 RepID=UPI000223B1FE|nr:serine hydrolase [Desulfosporosinus sp. OT]EGW40252.1 D-alanyl-D-alanine carboxypeptidase family protein [Desulfosporosinus sp. OT]
MKRTKRRYNRPILFISVIIIGLLSLVGYHNFHPAFVKSFFASALSAISETKPNLLSSNISTIATAAASKTDLSTSDESYVLIDPQTTMTLKSSNADVQRAPASTTKLLTGLIALQNLNETDIVRVGSEVNIDGSRLGLSPGDEISVHDLLTALYVHSANDAAAALAVKISGSIPAFADEMNQYAATLGCQYSHFTNPHGLPDPDHYTTANDLGKIASLFLKNEELMKFVKETSASVQWKDARGMNRYAEVQNTNSLLGIYPGDQGLKTGTTTAAGQCLVSYVTRPDGDLLLVLLGSKQRYRDTIKLLDEGWAEQRTNAALRGLAKDPRSLIMTPGMF